MYTCARTNSYVSLMHIYITYAHLYFPQDCHVPYDNHPSSASFPFFTGCKRNNCNPPPFSAGLLLSSFLLFLFPSRTFFPPFRPSSSTDIRMLGCSGPHRAGSVSFSIDLPPSALLLPPFFFFAFSAPRPERGGGLVPSFLLSPFPVPPKKSNYVTSRPELSGRACTPPPRI